MAWILVVDDEAQLRALLRRILEQAGYQVTEAADGVAAIDSYRQQPTALVITDIVMPEKDGLETIRELRRSDPGVKIVAISGGSPRLPMDFLPTAKVFGADRVIAKPFRPQDIVATVNELMGGL